MKQEYDKFENIIFYENEHSLFLNDFWNSTKSFILTSYIELIDSIKTNKLLKHNFTQNEIKYLILLTKSYYQYQLSFFTLVEEHMGIVAFNSLRAAIEANRLLRAYYIDEEFRNQYLLNSNIDFRNGNDYSFMQKKVCKILKEKESQIRSQDKIPLTPILHNHDLIEGSTLSEMHSELSRWSHLLNSNLLEIPYISTRKIYLGIEDEYSYEMELLIKQYLEGSFLLIMEHLEMFANIIRNTNINNIQSEMIDKYSEYVRLFY